MENREIKESEIYSQTNIKEKVGSKSLKLEVAGLAINLCTVAVFGAALAAAISFKIPPEIIAVNDSGSLFEKVPLNIGNKSDEQIRQWATDRILEAFSYDFTSQSDHTSTITHHYTPEAIAALDGFINGSYVDGKFNESMIKRRVNKEAGVVKLALADGVTLISGMVNNLHGWRANTKGTLVMHTKGGVIRLGRYQIEMVIIRADENETQDGVKIQSIRLNKLT